MAISGAILAIGLGTGLVASYMGLPVSVFSSAAGPEELQYVPADAAVVAYANVRDVMNSQFRQRFKDIEPSQDEKNEFEEKTGLNLEQDVDSVVAAVMPKDGMANNPAGAFLILARARYDAARLEALAVEHGAQVDRLPGQAPHHPSRRRHATTRRTTTWRSASSRRIWSPSAASTSVKASIDARRENRNVVSNNDMMKLVNEIDNANAWAVGRFDAIADKAGLPAEIAERRCRASRGSRRPVTSTAASAARFKAEAKDEATAKNLRDVMGGFLAMAKMQAGSKPGMQQLADSLVISGEGNTVALAFTIPTEVHRRARGHGEGPQAGRHSAVARVSRGSRRRGSNKGGAIAPPFSVYYPRRGRPRFFLRHADVAVQPAGAPAHHPEAHLHRARHHAGPRCSISASIPPRFPPTTTAWCGARSTRPHDAPAVLSVLDEIEGYRPSEPDRSLYTRVLTDVTLEDGRVEKAWTYFYNAPLGRAATHRVRRLPRPPQRALDIC